MYNPEQVKQIAEATVDCKIHYNELGRIIFKFGEFDFEFFADTNPAVAVEHIARTMSNLVIHMVDHMRVTVTNFTAVNKLNFN